MEASSTASPHAQLYQDVLSQFPVLNAYSNYLGIFKLADSISRESIVSSLRAAFEELKSSVIWLGYEVVNTGSSSGNSGYFSAKPWPAGVPRNDFIVKECDRLMASFADLALAGFPVSMLRASLLEPFPSLPARTNISPAPVSAIQVNFIQGGVIITLCCHHIMIDASGILSFRRMLAKVLNGEVISDNEVAGANLDRTRVIPLLAEGDPVKDHGHLLPRSQQDSKTTSEPPLPTPRWCIFRASRRAIEEICSLANDRRSTSWIPAVSSISMNDALAAYCWQRITATRLPILVRRLVVSAGAAPALTQIKRAIDTRRIMGVPNSYMGHMVYHASMSLPLSTVALAPLPFLACAMRRALDEVTNPWAVRSYATFLSKQPDRSGLLYGGPHDGKTDIGLSSLVTTLDWQGKHLLHYGPLLGKSAAWRKADHAPMPGCLYFLETERDIGSSGASGDGELVLPIMLCLASDELDALMEDPKWTKYFVPVVEPGTEVGGSFSRVSKL